ncbi:MAG: EamA family transporter RarD, partial [Anaerolineae bacterium]|nr:EamA family transporter RarD [Anaerolineae bacterium]
YLVTGVLLALNWLIYVWAVNSGHVVEGSLGYFINPLLSVVLGLIFLREKLRPLQWLPVGLAAAGVVYLTLSYGAVPWVSLALALTFGLYGLMKKIAPLGSLHGLTLETALVLPPVLIYLLVVGNRGDGAFLQAGLATTLLLIGCGVVTAVPLLFFALGARRVPLSTMGLLQYITPTIQFMTGVFLYHEPFNLDRAVGFAIIWLALIIFSVDGIFHMRRSWASSVA